MTTSLSNCTNSLFEAVNSTCPTIALDSDVRDVLSILSVLPEPMPNADLLCVLGRLGWNEARRRALAEPLAALTHSGLVHETRQNLELAWPLRKALRRSTLEDDRTCLRDGYRLLSTAFQKSKSDTPKVLQRHSAHILAADHDSEMLLSYLSVPRHFSEMCQNGVSILAISYWCEAVLTLSTQIELDTDQRIKLLRPVLRDVIHQLENQFFSMGRLAPMAQPLVAIFEHISDEVLFTLFDELMREMPALPGVDADVRGALALVQLFGEAGEFERQTRLAQTAMEIHDQFDVYHFASVAASHWGRHRTDEEGEALLHSALQIVRQGDRLPGSRDTASYPLRHTILAMSHYGLGNADRARNKPRNATRHYNIALRHIAKRSRNAQVLGYKAQILLALENEDDAWFDAREGVAKGLSSVDAGEVLLRTASNDLMNRRFTPYCLLQAVCCSLAHGPFVNDDHRQRIVSEAILPFLIRERVWPMAIALDSERTEQLSPGTRGICAAAHRGERQFEFASGDMILNVALDLWQWSTPERPDVAVLALEEFGIYVRGHSVDNALQNMGHVLNFLVRRSRVEKQWIRPIDSHIVAWFAAHTTRGAESFGGEIRRATDAYYLGHHEEAWEKLLDCGGRVLLTNQSMLREFQRTSAWVAAEVGEADPMHYMRDLCDHESPVLSTFTDLQKSAAACGMTPHPIVEAAHRAVEARGLTHGEHFFTPIERLYYGMYLLSTGRNARAEAMFVQALETEMVGPRQARLIARIGDVIAECLRRRGEHELARKMLEENITKREAENICIAPSLLQRAKCACDPESAAADIAKAIELYDTVNRKEAVRARLIQARISSDDNLQDAIRNDVKARANAIPALKNDPNLNNILKQWDAWCRPTFGPELDYWNL